MADADVPPRQVRMTVAYDGGDYLGWQVQPDGPTIQAELAKAILAVTGEATHPLGSGRTDSGVHALGQVATFRTRCRLPAATLRKALNANLPPAIVIGDLRDVAADFDPSRHALRKLYRYLLRDGDTPDPFARRHAWHQFPRLDAAAMHRAAQAAVGTHDFRCFETEWPNRASSVRTVYRLDVVRCGDWVSVDAEADGFLYNMVRAIVGTLAKVGRGAWPETRVAELIAAGDRRLAGPTAPAQGLYLVRVDYPAEYAGDPP